MEDEGGGTDKTREGSVKKSVKRVKKKAVALAEDPGGDNTDENPKKKSKKTENSSVNTAAEEDSTKKDKKKKSAKKLLSSGVVKVKKLKAAATGSPGSAAESAPSPLKRKSSLTKVSSPIFNGEEKAAKDKIKRESRPRSLTVGARPLTKATVATPVASPKKIVVKKKKKVMADSTKAEGDADTTTTKEIKTVKKTKTEDQKSLSAAKREDGAEEEHEPEILAPESIRRMLRELLEKCGDDIVLLLQMRAEILEHLQRKGIVIDTFPRADKTKSSQEQMEDDMHIEERPNEDAVGDTAGEQPQAEIAKPEADVCPTEPASINISTEHSEPELLQKTVELNGTVEAVTDVGQKPLQEENNRADVQSRIEPEELVVEVSRDDNEPAKEDRKPVWITPIAETSIKEESQVREPGLDTEHMQQAYAQVDDGLGQCSQQHLTEEAQCNHIEANEATQSSIEPSSTLKGNHKVDNNQKDIENVSTEVGSHPTNFDSQTKEAENHTQKDDEAESTASSSIRKEPVEPAAHTPKVTYQSVHTSITSTPNSPANSFVNVSALSPIDKAALRERALERIKSIKERISLHGNP